MFSDGNGKSDEPILGARVTLRQELNSNREPHKTGVCPHSPFGYPARPQRRATVSKVKLVGRSSITGQFVPLRYTDKHPRTTEKEHVRVGTRKK